MKVYAGENVRNVVLVGHGHAGKTSLVSAMLYTAGATQRLGRVDDGTASTDYDEEEISRKMSIATKIEADKESNSIVLENYSTQPVLLEKVHREEKKK